MTTRLGLFGGTFDPPHHGHLIAATEAADALGLDRLVCIPSGDPPHKTKAVRATADQRLRMLRAAVAADDRLEVDDLEIRRGGVSYTVDTLRELRERDPGAELIFLLGADQYRSLDSWREPKEVATLARLAVLARGGETLDTTGPYGGICLRISRIDISATEIRARIAAGKSILYYVPDSVREIIVHEGLYR